MTRATMSNREPDVLEFVLLAIVVGLSVIGALTLLAPWSSWP